MATHAIAATSSPTEVVEEVAIRAATLEVLAADTAVGLAGLEADRAEVQVEAQVVRAVGLAAEPVL